MEMNELQTLRHSASHMLAQAVKDFIRIQNLLSVRLLMTVFTMILIRSILSPLRI